LAQDISAQAIFAVLLIFILILEQGSPDNLVDSIWNNYPQGGLQTMPFMLQHLLLQILVVLMTIAGAECSTTKSGALKPGRPSHKFLEELPLWHTDHVQNKVVDDWVEAVPMEDSLPGFCKAPTWIETCFGAQGAKCEKVPVLDRCGEGFQAVSVGSLAHDSCCRQCTDGLQCSRQAPKATSSEAFNNDYPCALEWRKAVWNALDDRFWCVPVTDAASDVTPVKGTREYDTTTYAGHLEQRRILHNVAATSVLCAPAGTNLDCIGCSTCEDGSCSAGVGDSGFCCSGQFMKVQKDVIGKEWGTCAHVSDISHPFEAKIAYKVQLAPAGRFHVVPISVQWASVVASMALTAKALINSYRNSNEGSNQMPLLSI